MLDQTVAVSNTTRVEQDGVQKIPVDRSIQPIWYEAENHIGSQRFRQDVFTNFSENENFSENVFRDN